MEGSDILVAQLRQHGLTTLDAKLTPADFTTDLLYNTILTSLERLGSLTASERRKRFPAQLPTAAASRLAVAQSVVAVLQSAGCQLFGYDALVYPAEVSTKAVLAWLVAELARVADLESQRQHQQEESEHSQTTLQRGILGLQRFLDRVDPIGKKGAAALKPSIVAARQRSHRWRGSPALMTVPIESALASTVAGSEESEKNMLDQVRDAFKMTFAKSYVFAGDVSKPSLGQVATDSVCELRAASLVETKAFQKFIAPILADVSSEGTEEGISRFSYAALQKSNRRGGDVARGTSVEALFYNTSEAGLSEDQSFLAAKRARQAAEEAAMNAAVADVEATQKSVVDRETQRAQEERDVKAQLHQAKRTLREKQDLVQQLEADILAAENEIIEIKDRQKELEAAALARWEEAQEKQKLLSMMDDAEGSEALINQRIHDLKEKRRLLKEDIESKLQKVEKKREQLVEENSSVGDGRDEQLAELRQKIKEAKKALKVRTREVKTLEGDYVKCPKDIDRSGFLRLIFDMTANIRKQHQQLDKVKQEMAEVNRNIEQLEGKIRLLFSSVEERAYQSATGSGSAPAAASTPATASTATAKKDDKVIVDDFARQAYRGLVSIQESYTALISEIEQRGLARQELHELEEKSDKLKRLVGGRDLQRMKADLEAIQAENEALNEQLEAAGITVA